MSFRAKNFVASTRSFDNGVEVTYSRQSFIVPGIKQWMNGPKATDFSFGQDLPIPLWNIKDRVAEPARDNEISFVIKKDDLRLFVQPMSENYLTIAHDRGAIGVFLTIKIADFDEQVIVVKNAKAENIVLDSSDFDKLLASCVGDGNLATKTKVSIVYRTGSPKAPKKCTEPPSVKMFSDAEFCSNFADFALVSQSGEKVRVSRATLAIYSPVFKAMLSTECQEKTKGEVLIKEFGKAALSCFWFSILEGAISVTDGEGEDWAIGIGIDLWKLIDKYQVESLKKEIVVWLKEKVTIENVLKVVKFAHEFGVRDVSVFCQDYIRTFSRHPRFSFEKLYESDLPKALKIKLLGAPWLK